MTHALTRLHIGGHLYGPGGRGEHEFDPAPLLVADEIDHTRDLPGFVLGNTTYESHHFWLHFTRRSVLIRVHHGGGWEVWRGDYMLKGALQRYCGDDIGAFLMCWFLIDSARAAHDAGRLEATQTYQQAFVDGRLKKRKLPAQGKVKVWIEPKANPSQQGMAS